MKVWNYRNGLILAILLFALYLPLSAAAAQDGNGAQVGIFEDYELYPDSRVEIPVEVRDVSDLYAIDIEIKFDPEIITIEDADPNTDGIQPALGTFLDAGLTLFNTVDIESGVIRFVMSQVNPSEAKSGDGIVLVLYVQGLVEGDSELEVTTLGLSTRSGETISAEPDNAQVRVSGEAAAKQSTAIPVQDPGLMIQVPTTIPTEETGDVAPTLTPTFTTEDSVEGKDENPLQEITPEASEETLPSVDDTLAVSQESENDGEAQQNQVSEETANSEKTGFSLLEYWWIVAIVVALAAGLGLYVWVTRK